MLAFVWVISIAGRILQVLETCWVLLVVWTADFILIVESYVIVKITTDLSYTKEYFAMHDRLRHY